MDIRNKELFYRVFFRNINAIYGFLDNKQSYLIKGLKIIHIKNIEAAKGLNQSITSH